jgi:hypothetical protein
MQQLAFPQQLAFVCWHCASKLFNIVVVVVVCTFGSEQQLNMTSTWVSYLCVECLDVAGFTLGISGSF